MSAAKASLSIAVIWLVAALIAALEFGALVPRTRMGLVGLLVFGPPLYLLGEVLSDWLWSTTPAKALAEHPSRAFRIGVGVVVGSVVLAIVITGSVLMGTRIGA